MKGRGQRQEDKVIIKNGATTDVVMIEAKWGISFIGLSHLDMIMVNSVLICKDLPCDFYFNSLSSPSLLLNTNKLYWPPNQGGLPRWC